MQNLILDVDTGVDDALALTLAARHPHVRLLAVTCVAGNTNVDQVVRNTLAVLTAVGAENVPVARGAERPLLEAPRDASHVHGKNGLADIDMPEPKRTAVESHAIELLRSTILASPVPVTIVPVGPLTNIALLLRTHPEVQQGIERIVLMGGSASSGNATPVAEFNIWHDPEAAAIVFGSDVPITMYGLDVFMQLALSEDEVDQLGERDDPGADLVHRLLKNRPYHYTGPVKRMRLGDAGAVCAAIDPDGIGTRSVPVKVVLDGLARGQTLVDLRGHAGESDLLGAQWGRRIEVALEIDAERYRRLFLEHACGGLL